MMVVPIIATVAGYYAGGAIAGLIGAEVATGAMIGAAIAGMGGSMIAAGRQDLTIQGRDVGGLPVQTASIGNPVDHVFGTVTLAGNIVYLSKLITVASVDKKRMLGFIVGKITTITYKRSFLIILCEGPARILTMWAGKDRLGFNSANNITLFDGGENSDIATVVGQQYAKYVNMCCVYFDNYDLGNNSTLPNFIFEVTTLTSSNYVYTLDNVSGNGILLQKIDNLNGTFTTAHTLNITGNSTYDLYQDSKDCIYVVEGTNLKKYSSDLTLLTAWQTDGIKSIGTVFRIANVNKVNGYVYYVTGTDLVCLEEDGTVLWSIVLNNFTSLDCLAAFDHNQDLFLPVGPVSNANWYLVQHISHVNGSIIRYHCLAESTGDYVIGMSFDSYYDSIIIAAYVNDGSTYPYRIASSYTAHSETTWFRRMAFRFSGMSLTAIFCNLSGHIFVGASGSGLVPEDHFSVPNYYGNMAHFSSTGRFFGLGVRFGNPLYLASAVSFIGGYSKNEIVICLKWGSLYSWCNILDIVRLGFRRGIAFAGNHNMIMDSKNIPSDDMNAAEIVYDILTKPSLGNIDSSIIDTDTYIATKAYCEDNNINLSIHMPKQASLLDWLETVLAHFFGFISYKNGSIYIEVFKETESQFCITRDDIIDQIGVKEKELSQTCNEVKVEYITRIDNWGVISYTGSIVTASDWVNQRQIGQVISKTFKLPGITDTNLAQKTVDRYLSEMMYRPRTYNISCSYRKMTLEPGMVGTIDDNKKILNRKVRILTKIEAEDGKAVSFGAVDEQPHVYLSPVLAIPTNRNSPDIEPMLANPIITIFENPSEPLLSICIAPLGDVDYWKLYLSIDNISYELVDDMIPLEDKANAYGILTTSIPAYPVLIYCKDDYIEMDLTQGHILESASEVDFFIGKSLVKIGNEIIGFQIATDISDLIHPNRWRISNLIRGMYNTIPTTHSIGDNCATLIINSTIPYSEEDVSRIVYIIAVPIQGSLVSTFDECQPIEYMIKGLYKRPAPVSLVRIDDPDGEGIMEYTGATFTLEWQLGSKSAGFNIGCFNCDGTVWEWTDAREIAGTLPTWNDGIIWGSSPVESEITGIVLQFFDNADVFLSERIVSSAAVSDTITNATDLAGNIANYINVLPVSKYRTYYNNKISVNKI